MGGNAATRKAQDAKGNSGNWNSGKQLEQRQARQNGNEQRRLEQRQREQQATGTAGDWNSRQQGTACGGAGTGLGNREQRLGCGSGTAATGSAATGTAATGTAATGTAATGTAATGTAARLIRTITKSIYLTNFLDWTLRDWQNSDASCLLQSVKFETTDGLRNHRCPKTIRLPTLNPHVLGGYLKTINSGYQCQSWWDGLCAIAKRAIITSMPKSSSDNGGTGMKERLQLHRLRSGTSVVPRMCSPRYPSFLWSVVTCSQPPDTRRRSRQRAGYAEDVHKWIMADKTRFNELEKALLFLHDRKVSQSSKAASTPSYPDVATS